MADKRAFAKFDVGYLDNPKMLDVLDASSTAILMHFASVLYCAQHLTDGVVASKAMQRKAGGTEGDIQILLEHGLWHDAGHDCESCPQPPVGKVYVHDFLEHNRDAAEAKRVSKKRSDAAKARWNPSDADAKGMQNAMQSDDVSNAERERKKERKKEPSLSPASLDEFDRWYSEYPKKEAKEAARKAFKKARQSASLEDLTAGLERYNRSIQGKDRQFIALPATWLNAGRWEDEPATAATVGFDPRNWMNQ